MTTSAGANCAAENPADNPTCPVLCAGGFRVADGASSEITCKFLLLIIMSLFEHSLKFSIMADETRSYKFKNLL